MAYQSETGACDAKEPEICREVSGIERGVAQAFSQADCLLRSLDRMNGSQPEPGGNIAQDSPPDPQDLLARVRKINARLEQVNGRLIDYNNRLASLI